MNYLLWLKKTMFLWKDQRQFLEEEMLILSHSMTSFKQNESMLIYSGSGSYLKIDNSLVMTPQYNEQDGLKDKNTN